MSSKKLFKGGTQPKGPVAFKSINVRRLTIRLWAWKVFCFIKRKRNDLHKLQTKIGTMAMFIKFADSVAEELLEKSNYAVKMFDMVFGQEEIASLDWDGVVCRLRSFEDEEGLPNTIPFMTNFTPTPLTVQVHSAGATKPVDVNLTSVSDPKATAAETIVHYDLPHEELDHIISTLQHELLPLVRGDVNDRRDILLNFQRWLVTMQNLASKYDDTQMKLLKQAQLEEPDNSPKEVTVAVKPSSNKLASSFYKQLVETRRQLEEVESQIDRLQEVVGPADEEQSSSSNDFKPSRLQIVTEEVIAPVAGGRGRRASVSVRSLLDAAATKTTNKPQKAIFSVIEEDEEENEETNEGADVGSSFKKSKQQGAKDTEQSKTRLYQKAECDKAGLVSANLLLRDKLMSASNLEDTESRKIVSELKLWEQERDTLESQIEQHENYINSLRARISNYQSGNVRSAYL